jgi:hypothetical protein
LKTILKIAAVAALLVLAVGAIGFVYAFSQNGSTSNGDEQCVRIQWSASDSAALPGNATMWCGRMGRMGHMRGNDFPLNPELLQNATLSTVGGTVVATVRNMLILDTGSGQIRVLLAREWTVDGEVVDSSSLFNGTFASAGDAVTLNVIECSVFSNANFSINVMWGYEAVNASGTTAYAVLPFNIQPAS